jgi:hypothetical protein
MKELAGDSAKGLPFHDMLQRSDQFPAIVSTNKLYPPNSRTAKSWWMQNKSARGTRRNFWINAFANVFERAV